MHLNQEGGSSMFELNPSEFRTVHKWAKRSQVEKVYPCSITEGRQSGRVFVDNRQEVHTVLFWHYCGFAYLVGIPDKAFLREIARLLQGTFTPGQQRFILHVKDKALEAELDQIDLIQKNIRYNFVWQDRKAIEKIKPLPVAYEFQALDKENMKQLSGRIIPSFSWQDHSQCLFGCNW